ncbi:Meckelin, partial [Gorgonomyces haynaldii]
MLSVYAAIAPFPSFYSQNQVSIVCNNTRTGAVYDPTKLVSGCNTCPQYTVNGALETCNCSPGQYGIPCTPQTCTAPQIQSFDGTFCLTCPTTTTTITLPDGLTQKTICTCPTLNIIVQRNTTNNLAAAQCVQCPNGYYPSYDQSRCLSCPDPVNMIATETTPRTYTCTCLAGIFSATPYGGVCLIDSAIQQARQRYPSSPGSLIFSDILTTTLSTTTVTISSDVFSKYYTRAVVGCDSLGNRDACQQLANLCVLAYYDLNNAACKAYTLMAATRGTIMSDPYTDQPHGMPWIYYGLVNNEATFSVRNRIMSLSLTNPVVSQASPLQFVLGIYLINGTFLGYQKLDNQLLVCNENGIYARLWNRAGQTSSLSCQVNLNSIVSSNAETLLFDLFVYDSTNVLYPVPVRIKNYKDQQGNKINTESSPTDSNKLFRRFFWFDTQTGVSNGLSGPIRVPKTVQFWFQTVSDRDGVIYVPIMDIEYGERLYADISSTDSSQVSSPTFSFGATWSQDFSRYRQAFTILAALTGSFSVIASIYLTRSYNARNSGVADTLDIFFFIRFAVNLGATAGPVLFLIVYLMALYFLVFFKSQSILFLLIPIGDYDVGLFMLFVLLVIVSEAAYVSNEIFKQCNVSLFFMDWERSKGKLMSKNHDGVESAPVSAWRMIFMVNEWSRLQNFRRVNIEFALIGVIMLLNVFNWSGLSALQPQFQDTQTGSYSTILGFASNASAWVVMILIQFVFRWGFYDRYYRNVVLQYTDLLSLSNISLVVLDEKCHGYYVHGRSVHATADTSIQEINQYLRHEASDIVPRRGLNDTNDQCFEIFVTQEWRKYFDKLYHPNALQSDLARTAGMINRLANEPPAVNGSALSGNQQMETNSKMARSLNSFLKSFFEQLNKEFPYNMGKKTYWESMIGAAPDLTKGSTFFQDDTGFCKVLLLGVEFHLLILYICLFCYIHNALGSYMKAAGIIWLIDWSVLTIRLHFGRMNITRKTLLDAKFLL